jgi:hypothetical protein
LNNSNPDNNLKNHLASGPSPEQEQEKYLHLCHAVFKQNEKGAEWLEFMKKCLVEKLPTADPSKDPSHGFYREGQNSLIRAIIHNIGLYEEEIVKNNRSAGA